MINIISTQANKNQITGPYKVFKNLVKGLDKIGYPYVVNRDLNATKRLWIHDDIEALRYMHRSKAHKVVGPNLFVMPSDIPMGISFDGALYLQPCEWAKQVWELVGFNACSIAVWPVGIDTDEFQPSAVPFSERRVTVYHKERDVQELVCILETLHALKLKYSLVLYGRYSECEFKEMLATTSFVVWHGSHESQGLALQEAMACDIPILVCDATSLLQARSAYVFPSELGVFPVTAAPYFDATCGIKISDLCDLPVAIQTMQEKRCSFQPREYVLKHLSLEGQARALLHQWDRWGLTLEQGYRERPHSSRSFAMPMPDRAWNLVRRGKMKLGL